MNIQRNGSGSGTDSGSVQIWVLHAAFSAIRRKPLYRFIAKAYIAYIALEPMLFEPAVNMNKWSQRSKS